MDVVVTLGALALLIAAAYRGQSVILFAPLSALLAVLCTSPALVPPFFSGVYMERLAGFLKPYFALFLLGAVFGKLMELSGFARAIARRMTALLGEGRAMVAVVLCCALLTYGGVSLFVAAFAVYPFARELFRAADIPRRLIPGTIALGAFTFTMDALPGSPQIQNLIPTTFFHTTAWAAPRLGLLGALFVLGGGLAYLEWRRRQARARGEGYGPGAEDVSEGAGGGAGASGAGGAAPGRPQAPLLVALAPLLCVGALNLALTRALPRLYPASFDLAAAGAKGAAPLDTSKLVALWAVEGALLAAIALTFALTFALRAPPFGAPRSLPADRDRPGAPLGDGLRLAIAGALLAAFNTASEYGFGGVIAALPGFRAISDGAAGLLREPLLGAAVSTTLLAGMTGSASGGMSLALGALGARYLAEATAAGVPPEVLHRVAAMASGGMDTLPHNGAVITLLAVTGLTHRESYGDIFAMTLIKTAAVFVVIGAYYALRLV